MRKHAPRIMNSHPPGILMYPSMLDSRPDGPRFVENTCLRGFTCLTLNLTHHLAMVQVPQREQDEARAGVNLLRIGVVSPRGHCGRWQAVNDNVLPGD